MQTMMIHFIVKFVLVGDSNWFTVGVDRTTGQLVFELVTSGQQSKSGTNWLCFGLRFTEEVISLPD